MYQMMNGSEANITIHWARDVIVLIIGMIFNIYDARRQAEEYRYYAIWWYRSSS